jgi:hypothetical protein
MEGIPKMLAMKVLKTSFATMAVFMIPVVTQATTPVPGYVPPVQFSAVPDYADDTRGVFIPNHSQHRLTTDRELSKYRDGQTSDLPLYAQVNPPVDAYENRLNTLSSGYSNLDTEMDRIAEGTANQIQVPPEQPPYTGEHPVRGYSVPPISPIQPVQPYSQPQMNYGGMASGYAAPVGGEGVEIATGMVNGRTLDMVNSLVRLREDRISVRRALQRMMDQIGGGDWAVIWDLAEQNAGLPEMEISLYAEEPFMDVLNALLARLQTRSGQPLRIIRYDKTQRLVLTDRVGGHHVGNKMSTIGAGGEFEPAVTEQVLKESVVSLHYDEIPLVDAMESMVNQAGKGEWRLRVYAGLDQVLKPAHIEEPFSIGMERILRLFNLKYEVFPGGKLVVVTHNTRFGFESR